jgi:hypothetical protein
MPSTYTTNLVIEKPATGEQAGIWGTTANQTYDFIDMGIDGNASVGLSAASYDLRTDERASSVGRNKVIVFTGSLSNEGNVTISPNTAKKIYYVINKTGGGFGLTFKQGTGTTFRLLNGHSAIIYADGASGGAGSVAGVLNDFQVNSLLVQTSLIIGSAGSIQWNAPATFNQPSTFSELATFQKGATFSPAVTFNLGADASYDMYYRSSALGGPLARLGIGSPGDSLVATAGGPAWQKITAQLNMVVGGAVQNRIFFADASSQMVQDANLQYRVGVGMGLGMVPGRALCVGGNFAPTIQLDALTPAPGTPPAARTVMFTVAGAARWNLNTSGEVEAGPNAAGGGLIGSNLVLSSTNDAGTAAVTSFACYRSGRMTVGTYNDGYNSQFTVYNSSSSSLIQRWVNNQGATVASLDNNGLLTATVPGTGGGGGLTLNSMGRLDINGLVGAHPMSTLHIGPDNGGSTNGPNPAIVLEGTAASSAVPNVVTGNAIRLYYRNSPAKIVIQFTIAGTPYWAYMTLAADSSDGPYVWHITNNAQ